MANKKQTIRINKSQQTTTYLKTCHKTTTKPKTINKSQQTTTYLKTCHKTTTK